jgi:hypothetical protein
VIALNANTSGYDAARKTKRTIGMIAISLLVLFTILALLRIIGFLDWIILDLIVAFAANLLFRRINKKSL